MAINSIEFDLPMYMYALKELFDKNVRKSMVGQDRNLKYNLSKVNIDVNSL